MRHALSMLSDAERARLKAARAEAWREVRGFVVMVATVMILGALALLLER